MKTGKDGATHSIKSLGATVNICLFTSASLIILLAISSSSSASERMLGSLPWCNDWNSHMAAQSPNSYHENNVSQDSLRWTVLQDQKRFPMKERT